MPSAEPSAVPSGLAGAECASAPCQNGGTCGDSSSGVATIGVGTYACHCMVGWYGVNCETSEDDCSLGGGANTCAMQQPGTRCVDCARGRYVKFEYVANPECTMGFTCE